MATTGPTMSMWKPPNRQAGSVVLTLTKAQAEAFLSLNVGNNRGISADHVSRLAADFAEGRYIYDGTPIKFDSNGNMIDGQHRCEAAIKAFVNGGGVEVRVEYGLDPNAFSTIDSVRPRTAADVMHSMGIVNGRNVAATCRMIFRWVPASGLVEMKNRGLSKAAVCEMVKADGSIVDAVAFIRSSKSIERIAPSSVTSFCFWLFSHIDREAAVVFFSTMADGSNLPPGDGRLLFLRMMTNFSNRNLSTQLQSVVCGRLIKAWNLWRTGGAAQVLRFNPGDNFPMPV